MRVSHASPLNLFKQGASKSALIKAIWDPALAVIILFATQIFYKGYIDSPHVLLAIILFSMLYPSSIELHEKTRHLIREIIVQWFPTMSILFLLGFGTHTLALFQAAQAWSILIPVAWFVTHLLLPKVWPGLFAMEGVRSAVIIGANDIGCRLAEHFELKRYLRVDFMGFFDDLSRHGLE